MTSEMEHDWTAMRRVVKGQMIVTVLTPICFVASASLSSPWPMLAGMGVALGVGVGAVAVRCPVKGGPALGAWSIGLSDPGRCRQCGSQRPAPEQPDPR